MKNGQRMAVLLLAAVLFLIAGCSSSGSPKQALQNAIKKTSESDSYTQAITIGIDELQLPASTAGKPNQAIAAGIAGMLKGATLKINTVYQKEPLRTDMELNIVLGGLTVKVPILISNEKMYVQIPAIPLLKLPNTILGKYIEIDMEALAAQQQNAAALDLGAQMKLMDELNGLLLKHFDEKNYFSKVKSDEAGLPEGITADQVVRFAIDDSNYSSSIETIVGKVLPELYSILASNEAYLDTFQLKKEDVEKRKADLETNKAQIQDTLKEQLKVKEVSVTGAITGDYLSYQSQIINAVYTDKESGEALKLNLHIDIEYSAVGETPTFTHELPTDAVKLEDLTKLLKAQSGL
ncbi:hypothetical protein [Paenibacillus sp. NPDC058174]|uniref:hypothetical protein n=1 Tax=Paenibacillus sp. NPDC058174 TaxID=3346366 RepID=UPI0036DB998A